MRGGYTSIGSSLIVRKNKEETKSFKKVDSEADTRFYDRIKESRNLSQGKFIPN